MQIKTCNNKICKVKSEEGFTLLELIMVMVVTSILSSSLILPFSSSLRQGTMPEIYNTATYLAMDEMEWKRNDGYTSVGAAIDAGTNPLTTTTTLNNIGNTVLRNYTVQTVSQYVTHSAGNFSFSATPTEMIGVTTTVSNANIPNNVILSEILVEDFYNNNANND